MSSNEQVSEGQPERRAGEERRRLTLGTFLVGSLHVRRRADRRADDDYHVDWHEPDLLFLAVTTLLLSVIDAFFTLTLLRHGATEANPVLEFILNQHPQLFAVIKMTLTGGGVLVLVAAARAHLFRVVRVKTILQWVLLGYVILFGYEMWLLRDIF
ncbi:MAG: DUF5658 family protein [Gammaproteobacteria bacterium]|jgi:hypothetical protein